VKSKRKSKGKIIELIKDNPFITISELAELTGLSIAGIEKNMRTLKTDGILSRKGSANGSHWEIVE
jgi:ATP-dependent DNA helicase RecG